MQTCAASKRSRRFELRSLMPDGARRAVPDRVAIRLFRNEH